MKRLLELIRNYSYYKGGAKSHLKHERDWYNYLADRTAKDILQHIFHPFIWAHHKVVPHKKNENELPF